MTEPLQLQEDAAVRRIVAAALTEDHADQDVTTRSLVPADALVTARIETREPCVVSGMEVAACVFDAVDPAVTLTPRVADGDGVPAGARLLDLAGPARAILTGERTALNLMQRMCGIATLTRAFAERVAPWGTMVLDTRKTTPGLRVLEKYAVRCGGGTNHRMALHDRAMIKDNHRRLWSRDAFSRLDLAVQACRDSYPGVPVEVEVESEDELRSALEGAPEWILLDNMSPDQMRRCVELTAGCAKLEASGGITLETVAAVAATGVDAISLGCLTHSVRAIDLSLEMEI